jgi:hypothetical protein
VRDGVQNSFGCRLQQVGNAEVEFAFSEADGVVDAGKREEMNMNFGHRSAWTKLAVSAMKNLYCRGKHDSD